MNFTEINFGANQIIKIIELQWTFSLSTRKAFQT